VDFGLTATLASQGSACLLEVSYDDGVTPSVSYGYDRLGRPSTNSRNGITTTFAYDTANDPLGGTYSGGVLGGLSVTNRYASLLRRVSSTVLNASSLLTMATTSYDAAGRLAVVSDGNGNSAAYSYVANSPLVDHIVFSNRSGSVMTTHNTFDSFQPVRYGLRTASLSHGVNRLTGKTSASSAQSVVNAPATFDSCCQRSGLDWDELVQGHIY
jgi:hypothetical protein